MPLYDYECSSCGHQFEVRQSFTEAGVAQCVKCGHKACRVFHSVPVFFKGSGFYSTDYKKGPASYSSNGKEAGKEGKEKEPASAKTDSSKAKGEGSSSESE